MKRANAPAAPDSGLVALIPAHAGEPLAPFVVTLQPRLSLAEARRCAVDYANENGLGRTGEERAFQALAKADDPTAAVPRLLRLDLVDRLRRRGPTLYAP